MSNPSRKNPLVLLAGLAVFVVAAYQLSQMVLSGDTTGLIFMVLAVVAAACILTMLNDWRTGTFIFFGWLFFEDLARKYLGNNMLIYFGKDILVGVVYFSFFIAYTKKKVEFFKPPFFVPLLLFAWFGVVQVFNPGSSSVFYGLLGMKLYFYYVPLFFIGYAFFQTEEDLHRFYPYLMAIFTVIAGLGIIQSVVGPSFLNPINLQEDIRELSTTYRVAPMSGVLAYRPTSVFVSGGRFAFLLTPAWLFAFGFGVYLLLRSRRHRIITMIALGCTSLAIAMCAARGTLMWTLGSALVCIPVMLWGCPWEKGQLVRVLRSFQRSILIVGAVLFVMFLVYPDPLKARFSIYSETLDPSSPTSELVHRAQAYPMQQFFNAFDYPRWPYGYGIGTASLGAQYVTRILHAPYMGIGVESGFGALILELGIGGLALYLVLAVTIVVTGWRVVRKLRGTPWFPLGFVIFWYSILFLFAYLWGGFQQFEDFILNSMLWFSLGILYRLPAFIGNPGSPGSDAAAPLSPAEAR